jgi:hypothetical protein
MAAIGNQAWELWEQWEKWGQWNPMAAKDMENSWFSKSAFSHTGFPLCLCPSSFTSMLFGK